MSANARSSVTIVFEGQAQNLEAALKELQTGLAGFGAAATAAGEKASGRLAPSLTRTAHEAQGLGVQLRATAEMTALLGAESSEAVLKVQGLGAAFDHMREASGGMKSAVLGGIGAIAAFGALDFLRESVGEAEKGEAAWARLGVAYRGNAAGLEQVKRTIEDTRATWEKLGLTQAQVADMAARARGLGLDPAAVLGDPGALADVAKVLRTDVGGALDAIARPRGVQQVLSRLGLGKREIAETVAQLQGASAAQRVLFLEQRVAASAFAGQGLADAGTAPGKFRAFHTAMADLREEVGTALIPALTQLATALTSMLQAADALARPFGGLANVLRVLFLPMLAGGLLLFTNLRGVLGSMVDLLLGRLVGAFGQTAGSLAEADASARELTADLASLPEAVTTTAAFVPATAIKDAYKANIYSIPTTWATVATFEPATVTEPAVAPVHVPVIYSGALSEQGATPVRVPVIYNGALSESHSAPVRVPVIYQGVLHAVGKASVIVDAIDHVTEAMPGIIGKAQKFATSHPIKVLAQGVGAGATFGAAFAISDAIFNGAVTFNKVSMPSLPHVTWSTADQKQLETLTQKLSAPLKVHVEGGKLDNIGAIGGALVTHMSAPDQTLLKQQIAALQAQKTAADDYAKALADAKKHPLPVDVHFNKTEMAKMVGEIALGTLIANVLGSILNPAKLIGLVKGGALNIGAWLGGKGLETEAAGGAASTEATAINDLMGKGALSINDAVAAAQDLFKGIGGGGGAAGAAEKVAVAIAKDMGPALDTVAPMVEGAVGLKVGGALIGGLGDILPMVATGAVDLGALVFSGIAEGVTAGLATPLVAALLAGLGVVTVGVFTHGFGLLGADGKKEAAKLKGAFNLGDIVKHIGSTVGGAFKNMTALVGSIGLAIIEGIKTGVKRGMVGLINAIIDLFNAAISKVTFGHGPHIGHLATAMSGGTALSTSGGKFGLSTLSPDLVAQVNAVTRGALGGTGAAGAAAAHHTTTLHATINVNGAQDPHRVAQEVNHALAEFMGGVKASRRLHG